MTKIELRYLKIEQDRHGNWRVYVRRHGKKIRIRETQGTPEFFEAYRKAVERLAPEEAPKVTPGRQPFPTGTFGWLGAKYFASDEFQALDAQSQRNRRNILESLPHRKQPPRIRLELLGRGLDRRLSIGCLDNAEPLAICSKLVDAPGRQRRCWRRLRGIWGLGHSDSIGQAARTVPPIRRCELHTLHFSVSGLARSN